MEGNVVNSAEKEASEVLHSLLSVERIEKPLEDTSIQQIVVVHDEDSKNEVDWNTSDQQPLYTLNQDEYVESSDTVIWSSLEMDSIDNQSQILVDDTDDIEVQPPIEKETETPIKSAMKKPVVRKKYKRVFNVDERTVELENNVQDVRARFELGCECNDDSCFRGLNPETVYRHRLNIAELTKEEHDMYLMGVTMACMSDPGVTVKRKERRRLRAHYVYQGRRVCLSAFLYLENCTLYQLKRIRKHVMTHGVTPRVHGNHGKKPHNVFSLDIYRRATTFLKSYIEKHTSSSGNLKSPVVLPFDVSRKMIHNAYQDHVKCVAPPDEKIMGYSTFRHFMKEQFPHVRFCKAELEDVSAEEPGLSVNDVVELLQQQFAIITGGKSHEGYPLIILPDTNNFSDLNDKDYQKLMMYLTSVPSMQEADMGFAIVIDRRNDKWSSVKGALLKLSGFFPGLVHIAYVIRPSGFLQKAISEVSNKLFKEEFKFKVVVCSCTEELHQCLARNELTTDMDGTMPYCHQSWIQQRIALEHFSRQMRTVSLSLDSFTIRLRGSTEGLETENDSTSPSVRAMLISQTSDYSALKEEILRAARRGDDLLADIRHRLITNDHEPSSLVNITAVERLLVQLEETERTFDDFWEQHSARLRQCLDLQKFYTDFKKNQFDLVCHLKTVSQSTEIGETVQRVDYLIKEFNNFQRLCIEDMERSEELISMGDNITRSRHYWPVECVAVRCEELQRMGSTLRDRLDHRSDTLAKSHQLQLTVDKANKWCAKGIELLGARHIENCSCALDAAEQSLAELQIFIADAEQFHSLLVEYSTPETKALVSQVLQRIEDVRTMCHKRITTLKRLVEKPPRPVQTVTPEPGIPLQPSLRATSLTIRNKEEDDKMYKTKENALEKEEEIKRGHVLSELLETERVYVAELGSIIQGYKNSMVAEDTRELVPAELEGKADVLFGNWDDIYCFHGDIFLQDLENCISTTELVALCFTHRRDAFHRLYSSYCQNIPRSERLRSSLGENSFFRTCQARLGHKLPLAAYLLKPVQRITKYQLLLKDLLSHSEGQKWCGELQEALECMLVVLKCVNDSMHQTAITGYWGELSDLGDLLMQGDFSVWGESKKDRLKELRLKPMQRHIFLYQKAILFCKKTATHNKATYHFKRLLKMSEIGLTETVRCDGKTFEVWMGGRSEVYTIQAATPNEKGAWVDQIKNLLLHQLTQLKMKQFCGNRPIGLRQAVSLDSSNMRGSIRTLSCDEARAKPSPSDDDLASSSDISNSEDEETFSNQTSRYVALADYTALGHSELSMKEGDKVSLLKVGCAGWWYVRHLGLGEGSRKEGWVPAAYLEHCGRKSSRSSQSVTSQASSIND